MAAVTMALSDSLRFIGINYREEQSQRNDGTRASWNIIKQLFW